MSHTPKAAWTGTQLSAGALATNAINFMSVTTGDLINASITTNGIQTVLPAGRVQRFDFTATHRWLYGVQPVVGYMYVLTSPKGWQVSRQYRPPTKRAADEAMLDFIRTHHAVRADAVSQAETTRFRPAPLAR